MLYSSIKILLRRDFFLDGRKKFTALMARFVRISSCNSLFWNQKKGTLFKTAQNFHKISIFDITAKPD